MLRGIQVKEYFKEHPECAERLKNISIPLNFPYQNENREVEERPLEVDDIQFITFEGWEGQKGVFAWYYPLGIPHYCKID